MFWLGLIIGLMVGGTVSLFLYSCIVAGARADEQAGYTEVKGDNRYEYDNEFTIK